MKKIIILSFMLCFAFTANGYSYTEEEIISVLQKKFDLLDPENTMYLTKEDKKVIDDFLSQNAKLLDSLGSSETEYYIKLINLNRIPGLNVNIARHAVAAYKKYYSEYSLEKRAEIEQALFSFNEKHYLSKENMQDIQKLKAESANGK